MNATNQSNLVDYFSSEKSIKPAIHDKKARIDQLHACAISWNLCCDLPVELKPCTILFNDWSECLFLD